MQDPPPPTIVLAIGRQIGSGGAELGERLARRLNFAYIDRQIMQEAARCLGVDEAHLLHRAERTTGFWEKLGHILSMGIPESVYTDALRVPEVTDVALFGVSMQVIRELVSNRDTVLIGHAGFHCLRGWPGLVSVFTHAPREFRVRRMAMRYHITDPAEARAVIDRTDAERERFIRQMAGVSWTDARNYDLCLDMSRVTFDMAEQMVVNLIEQRIGILAATPAPVAAPSASQGEV
ncbi:MAG: putative cytidylate kinase [Phycisphaerales bacterium]|jgi:cytidylate kinase|nr:putative cytidylate kinase [Phycisphaerales bacterium]